MGGRELLHTLSYLGIGHFMLIVYIFGKKVTGISRMKKIIFRIAHYCINIRRCEAWLPS